MVSSSLGSGGGGASLHHRASSVSAFCAKGASGEALVEPTLRDEPGSSQTLGTWRPAAHNLPLAWVAHLGPLSTGRRSVAPEGRHQTTATAILVI